MIMTEKTLGLAPVETSRKSELVECYRTIPIPKATMPLLLAVIDESKRVGLVDDTTKQTPSVSGILFNVFQSENFLDLLKIQLDTLKKMPTIEKPEKAKRGRPKKE